MSVFRIPKKTLKVIDSLRRSFFWAGEDACSGAQCLIAWKNVCSPKKIGGLGLKNLHVQNNCLLMKFAVKALSSVQSPWLDWLDLQHPNALVSSAPQTTFLCRTITQQIPTLQSITFVLTNSGTHTYFWLDTWLTPKPLATTFPHLFLHSILQMVKVANILRFSTEANLRNRLSLTAE
ncbi:hypothetical protein ACQJBY_038595 [Aegilops geniculata]